MLSSYLVSHKEDLGQKDNYFGFMKALILVCYSLVLVKVDLLGYFSFCFRLFWRLQHKKAKSNVFDECNGVWVRLSFHLQCVCWLCFVFVYVNCLSVVCKNNFNRYSWFVIIFLFLFCKEFWVKSLLRQKWK